MHNRTTVCTCNGNLCVLLAVNDRNSDDVGVDGVRQFRGPHAAILQASVAR